MDEKNSLAETENNEVAIERKDAPVTAPARKAVKKKSTITKLVLMGLALVIGIIFAFVPMRFGFTLYHPFLSAESISLGLDLQGGVYAVYQATNTDTGNFEAKIEGTRSSLEQLLADKGYTEATVVREGSNRIRVEVPDVDDPSNILSIIGEPTTIKFVLDNTGETVITGDHVISADAYYDQENGYVVSLELNSEGRERFGNATSNNIGETMSIYVGDSSTALSSPSINSAITNGRAIITGNFTAESAQELAGQIMSGTFDVALELKETQTISPTLGENAMKYGLIAGIVGFVLVIVFLCVIYRMLGVAASLALVAYLVIYLFFLAVLPWVQLTLPGIAGILLSIGMAVDANVIIFERIKDEYRGGKSIMAAYHAGFKKALFAILDSNITTVIACVLLMLLGTGSVYGFALTLLVGVLISLFTALIISRAFVKYFINLNSYNAKLYNLKRGSQFEGLEADATDAAIMADMARVESEKQKAKEEKKLERARAKKERQKERAEQNNQGGEQA
ncbi:MAG: protein translocase subunit SecD [Clostridiales bacterium]|nr:protein translocase subunit SecD [Clostridiales bacterium]